MIGDKIDIFNYKNNKVRIIKDDKGEPWWVAKDVCDVLYLSNSRMATAALDVDERCKFHLHPGAPATLINESGLSYVNRIDLGLQPGKPMTTINESG